MPNAGRGDYDIDDKRHYRVEAGQNSPYGKVSYRVLTNLGSGAGWYQAGKVEDHQMVATGRSVEALGENINKSKTNAQDPVNPAKLISAKHGDIVLEAIDGDIILIGDNILMYANGIRNDGDGDIQMYANKGINVQASDIKIKGTNVRIFGVKDLSLIGKVYGEFTGGVINMVSGADFGAASLISKLQSIANSLSAF